MITKDALEELADEMMRLLAEGGPWDGVLMALHGAAVAEHLADVDGYLLRRARETVGPDVPIGTAMDLHANISPAMVKHSDVLVTYRTNPHVDARERAIEVAELIIGAARGQIRPVQALQQLPAAINILCQNTGTPPMRDVLADLAATMAVPGVLTATVAEGYPYADVPEMGMAVVVVTDGDRDAAHAHARQLAGKVWARRAQFDAAAASVEDALRRGATAERGPVLLLDVGDNIGGGSPGDSVVILSAAIRLGIPGVLSIIADPEAARACETAGVGAQVALTIGAKTDPDVGPPLAVSGTVRALHDGVWEDTGPTHTGTRHYDAGPSAAVDLDGGQILILCSRVVMPASPGQLTSLGIDPAGVAVIVAKGVHSPLAGYGPLAADVIQVDTPGVTAASLSRLTYRNRRQPLFPFEPEAAYAPPGGPASPAGEPAEAA
jgi:microcystin degradation protein MlrC